MEPAELVSKMNGVARVLRGASDLDGTLAAILEAAATVPGATLMALTWADSGAGEYRTVARANHEHAELLERLQDDAEEGPSLDAALTRRTVSSVDLAAEDRWPLCRSELLGGVGVTGVIATPFVGEQGTLATLTWWATDQGAFGDDEVAIAELLATRAAASLSFATTVETLNDALDSRSSIGAAIGIVMERYSLDRDSAFRFLVRLSQNGNVKLRAVAEKLIESQEHDADSDVTSA